MPIAFVDTGSGNDANTGLDNIGVGLATATWTESSFTLTQNGHGYTFAAGDVIYISGGTGATPGLYEVASSTANDIVLVETSTLPDVGNASDLAAGDLATGDISSSSGPWATIDKAMNTISGGDVAYVKAGTYSETATIDTAGSSNLSVRYEGYTTSLGDGGKATIDGGSSRASGILDSLAADTDVFHVFKNFIIQNHTSHGVNINVDHTAWKNCEFISNGGHGISAQRVLFEACLFNDNSADGADVITSYGIFIGCQFFRNAATGVRLDYGTVAFSEFFSNVDESILFQFANTLPRCVINCTVDGDADDTTVGIFFHTSYIHAGAVVNTVVYDCATGITSPDQDQNWISRNNLVNANATDYTNFDTFSGEQTGAPSFVDEANQDYTPTGGSPMVSNGTDRGSDIDIGAIQRAAGSGGGLLMPNKRAGKQ